MLTRLLHKVGIALIPLSARVAIRTWTDMARPPEAIATVHAGGTAAYRVLLIGGSSAVGFGTTTHQLALAGHLARQTAAITDRGLDLEVNASAEMTVARVRAVLTPEKISRYDAIVLTIGTREGYELMPTLAWRAQLASILDLIAAAPVRAPAVILVGGETEIPVMLPSWIAAPGRAKVRRLNAASRALVAERAGVVYIDSPMTPGRTDDGSTGLSVQALYASTAEGLAPTLAAALMRAPRRSLNVDENSRGAAVSRIATPGSVAELELDRLVGLAKDLIGTTGAALDIIGTDQIWSRATAGLPPVEWPRADALANDALAARDGLVVADLSQDPRYLDRSYVTGPPHLRFYAGYPVHSPDGYRVAMLGIFDTRPRTFRASHAALLRQLAQRAGRLLFEEQPLP